jgi:hypothetical protein
LIMGLHLGYFFPPAGRWRVKAGAACFFDKTVLMSRTFCLFIIGINTNKVKFITDLYLADLKPSNNLKY